MNNFKTMLKQTVSNFQYKQKDHKNMSKILIYLLFTLSDIFDPIDLKNIFGGSQNEKGVEPSRTGSVKADPKGKENEDSDYGVNNKEINEIMKKSKSSEDKDNKEKGAKKSDKDTESEKKGKSVEIKDGKNEEEPKDNTIVEAKDDSNGTKPDKLLGMPETKDKSSKNDETTEKKDKSIEKDKADKKDKSPEKKETDSKDSTKKEGKDNKMGGLVKTINSIKDGILNGEKLADNTVKKSKPATSIQSKAPKQTPNTSADSTKSETSIDSTKYDTSIDSTTTSTDSTKHDTSADSTKHDTSADSTKHDTSTESPKSIAENTKSSKKENLVGDSIKKLIDGIPTSSEKNWTAVMHNGKPEKMLIKISTITMVESIISSDDLSSKYSVVDTKVSLPNIVSYSKVKNLDDKKNTETEKSNKTTKGEQKSKDDKNETVPIAKTFYPSTEKPFSSIPVKIKQTDSSSFTTVSPHSDTKNDDYSVLTEKTSKTIKTDCDVFSRNTSEDKKKEKKSSKQRVEKNSDDDNKIDDKKTDNKVNKKDNDDNKVNKKDNDDNKVNKKDNDDNKIDKEKTDNKIDKEIPKTVSDKGLLGGEFGILKKLSGFGGAKDESEIKNEKNVSSLTSDKKTGPPSISDLVAKMKGEEENGNKLYLDGTFSAKDGNKDGNAKFRFEGWISNGDENKNEENK